MTEVSGVDIEVAKRALLEDIVRLLNQSTPSTASTDLPLLEIYPAGKVVTDIDDFKSALCYAFFRVMKKKGLTQTEVSERLNIKQSQVSRIIRGDTVSETKILESLLNLGCDIDIIIKEGDGHTKVYLEYM